MAGLVHFWDRGLVFSLYLTWKVGKLQKRLNCLNFFGEPEVWICKVKGAAWKVRPLQGVPTLSLPVEEGPTGLSKPPSPGTCRPVVAH